jgi:hypothetical protein
VKPRLLNHVSAAVLGVTARSVKNRTLSRATTGTDADPGGFQTPIAFRHDIGTGL